jgi:hypothetical protein
MANTPHQLNNPENYSMAAPTQKPFSVSPTSGAVAPAVPPGEATPSVVVQPALTRTFAQEPVAVVAKPPTRFSARTQAEHAAGAEALANYQ